MRWLAFPLHPETPPEGTRLEQLFSGRGADLAGMTKRLRDVAGTLGLPLDPSGTIYNTRLAQELAKWAESENKANEIHQALFRAYFVDGRNIGQTDTLVEIALSVGLPGAEARRAVEERSFRAEVDRDWDRSSALGIHAVPTFVMGGRRLVGFPTYEAMEQFVRGIGVARRNEGEPIEK